MFKKLGLDCYVSKDENGKKIIQYIKAKHVPDRINTEYIVFKQFMFSSKKVEIESWVTDAFCQRIRTDGKIILDIEELKAINDKMKKYLGDMKNE